MNGYRMFSIETSALELIKHGWYCIEDNQLLTKSPIKLKDNTHIIKHSSRFGEVHTHFLEFFLKMLILPCPLS
jgi:hypothetical protein